METPKRSRRIALALTEDEYATIVAHAPATPPAVLARQIIMDRLLSRATPFHAGYEDDPGVL